MEEKEFRDVAALLVTLGLVTRDGGDFMEDDVWNIVDRVVAARSRQKKAVEGGIAAIKKSPYKPRKPRI